MASFCRIAFVVAIGIALIACDVMADPAPPARPRGSVVFCRWVEHGQLLGRGWECIHDGEKKTIDATAPKVFFAREKGADAAAKNNHGPQALNVQEGTRIEITVVDRKTDGLVLDIAVNQTTVPTVVGHANIVDLPLALSTHQARKEHVFVAFDQILHVPLTDAADDPRAPAVDIFLGDGPTIHFDMPIPPEFRAEINADREEIFQTLMSHGAKVYGLRLPLWQKLRGCSLLEELDLDSLEECAELAEFWGQLTGRPTWLGALWRLVEDELCSHRIEEALFGSCNVYTVLLTESPTLVEDIRRLGDVPDLHGAVIYTDNVGEEILAAVRDLHLASVEINSLADRGDLGLETNGQDIAYVAVRDAERMIPGLRKLPQIEHVLISASPAQAAQVKKTASLLEDALPSVSVHAVIYAEAERHD